MKGSCLVARERIDWNTEERAREGRKGALSLSLVLFLCSSFFSLVERRGKNDFFFRTRSTRKKTVDSFLARAFLPRTWRISISNQCTEQSISLVVSLEQRGRDSVRENAASFRESEERRKAIFFFQEPWLDQNGPPLWRPPAPRESL